MLLSRDTTCDKSKLNAVLQIIYVECRYIFSINGVFSLKFSLVAGLRENGWFGIKIVKNNFLVKWIVPIIDYKQLINEWVNSFSQEIIDLTLFFKKTLLSYQQKFNALRKWEKAGNFLSVYITHNLQTFGLSQLFIYTIDASTKKFVKN